MRYIAVGDTYERPQTTELYFEARKCAEQWRAPSIYTYREAYNSANNATCFAQFCSA